MSEPGIPTLDQLAVFATVVDCGSFSGAARRLNRTQSVISYTIARLEAQLGVRLFERSARQPLLTDAGKTVLGDARRVKVVIDQLRARAKGLSQGLEAEVALAVDVMTPQDFLVEICREFAQEFPTVSLVLRVEALETLMELVLDGACELAIAGPILELPDDLDRRHCRVVQLVTVAAARHPLSSLGSALSTAHLREHTQLVLAERTVRADARGFAAYSVQTWRVSELSLLKALLDAGAGWAAMPEPMIALELASGRFARLALAGLAEWPYPLDVIRRIDTPLRPATRWLSERLASAGRSAAAPDPGEPPLRAGGETRARDR